MTVQRIALLGFGNVGRAFARLLLRKGEEIETRYGFRLLISGIYTRRHGYAIHPEGLPLEEALQAVEDAQSLNRLSHPSFAGASDLDSVAFARECPAEALVEVTPVEHRTGEPAVSHLRAALESGRHAVTANKGPVVHAYRELKRLAEGQRRRFLFEAAVMDGAPIFSLFRRALPAANLRAFRGILNSTTNLILSRMEEGETFEQAVAYAQRIGIAETDPSADVDGWDAAIKVAALVTVLMDTPLAPQQVEREGIRSLTPADMEQARQAGRRWKLLCEARLTPQGIQARVSPQMVASDSPFFTVSGTSAMVEFQTDVLGDLTIGEANPGPDTTAYGLLADALEALVS